MNFKPLSNYIVLDAIQKVTTLSLVIPETVDKRSDGGVYYDLVVVAISEEKDEQNKPFVRNVKIGDSVLLSPHSAPVSMEFEKKKYLVCRETELIGIFTKDESIN